MSAKEAVGKVKHTADHYINYVCRVLHQEFMWSWHPSGVERKRGVKCWGFPLGGRTQSKTKFLNDLLVSFISKATARVYTKTNHTPTPILFFWTLFWNNPINFQKRKKGKALRFDWRHSTSQWNWTRTHIVTRRHCDVSVFSSCAKRLS